MLALRVLLPALRTRMRVAPAGPFTCRSYRPGPVAGPRSAARPSSWYARPVNRFIGRVVPRAACARLAALAAVIVIAAATVVACGQAGASPGQGGTSPGQGSAGPGQTATGVVIAVDGNSGAITGFTLRTAGGEVLTFRIGTLETDGAAFPAAHLTEHAVTLDPVAVAYRDEGGARVVYRLTDAAASPSPSG